MTNKPTALQSYYAEFHKHADFLREFSELQASANPLSPEDIRGMIDRNPGKFQSLEKWAAPKKA